MVLAYLKMSQTRVAVTVSLYILVLFFGIILHTRKVDPVIFSIWDVFAGRINFSEIPPQWSFLLVNFIPNAYAAILVRAFNSKLAAEIVFLSTPYILLVSLLLILPIKNSAVGKSSILLAFAFSVVLCVPTWVGYGDGFVLLFQVAYLAFYRNSAVRLVAAILCVFSHPQIGVVSLFLAELMISISERKVRVAPFLMIALCFLMAKLTQSVLFPGAPGREEYLISALRRMLADGLPELLPFFLSKVVPVYLLLRLAGGGKEGIDLDRSGVERLFALLLITTPALIISVLLTQDKTRVFGLLVFPAYAVFFDKHKEMIVNFLRNNLVTGCLISLMIIITPQIAEIGWYTIAYRNQCRLDRLLAYHRPIAHDRSAGLCDQDGAGMMAVPK